MQLVCNQSFLKGTDEERGARSFACRCAQNGINVTLGVRVSLP